MKNSYKNKIKKGSGSVFLLAGILLVLMCVAEIFRILYFSPLLVEDILVTPRAEEGQVEVEMTHNVFDTLHTKYPSFKKERSPLQKYIINPLPHNPYLGQKESFVKLIVFTDMSCTPCREDVASMLDKLAEYMDKIHVVFKFYPKDGRDLQAGMFEQVARRTGVFPNYLNRLLQKQNDIDTDDFMYTLEKAGVSLTRLRIFMGEYSSSILDDLQLDLDQAERLGLKAYPLPVYYLNGYRLGQQGLPASAVVNAVTTLLDGRDLQPLE